MPRMGLNRNNRRDGLQGVTRKCASNAWDCVQGVITFMPAGRGVGINRKCASNAWDCLLLSLQGGGRHYFEA